MKITRRRSCPPMWARWRWPSASSPTASLLRRTRAA